jgi:nitrite reductase/ring-hydroxylating ferredoxin subunit
VTDIPHLALAGKKLTCPKHKWAFDVSTGECVEKGTRPLNQFTSRITEGRLQANW